METVSVQAKAIIKKMFPLQTPKRKKGLKSSLKREGQPVIEIAGEKNIQYKLAACCHPKQENRIIGYVTRGGGISIHNSACGMLGHLHPSRFLSAQWEGQKTEQDYLLTRLKIRAHDRIGVLREILEIVDKLQVNVLDIRTANHDMTEKTTDIIIDIQLRKLRKPRYARRTAS